MRITFKPLSKEHVFAFSDIRYGFLGRDEAVTALKQLIEGIEDPKLLKRIDRIKPERTPQQSLVKLILWLEDIFPGMYFKTENGINYLGTTNSGIDEIYAFPIDFVPTLKQICPEIEEIFLHALYSFINYQQIADPMYGNRLYNIEFSEDSLIDQARTDDPDGYFKKILDNIEYMNTHYANRLLTLSTSTWSIWHIKKKIKDLQYPVFLKPVEDLIYSLLDLSDGPCIHEYAKQALDMFCELNDIPKDEDGMWDFYDGSPVCLDDLLAVVWDGPGEDLQSGYWEAEMEYAANDYSGHFGHCTYSIHEKVTPNLSIDKLLEMNNQDHKFFGAIKDLLWEFKNVRKTINQINDSHAQFRIQPGSLPESLRTG